MEDEVARMLADLGAARREIISAPDTDKRGCTIQRDRDFEAAMKEELQLRRARFQEAADSADERTRALGEWNNQAVFSRDHFAENQSDWLGGQAHRLPGRARTYDSHIEELENQVGEERRLYLQERQERQARGTGNYSTASGPASGGCSPSSRMPRVLPTHTSAPRGPGSRQHVPSPRPSSTRAPSPRGAGTVRFVAGQRVSPNVPASRVLQNQVASIRAAQALAAGTAPARAGAPSTSARPPSATSSSHSTASSSRRAPPSIAQPPPKPPVSRLAESASTRSATAATSVHSEAQKAVYRTQAEYWAAHPGREADLHHAEHPDRVQYLRPARIKLIKEACRYARFPTSPDTVAHLTDHEDQRWIFEGVCRAKGMIENKSVEEVDDYYADHRDEADFCKAVRFYINDGYYGHGRVATARPAAAATESAAPQPPATLPVGAQSAESLALPTAPQQETAAAAKARSRSTLTAENSAAAFSTAPTQSKGGLMLTCVYAIGKKLLRKRFELDAALDVTLNVNILDPFLSLQDLIAQTESLGKAMQGPSSNLAASMASILHVASMSSPVPSSAGAATATTGMSQPPRREYDVHLADDGLYDSD